MQSRARLESVLARRHYLAAATVAGPLRHAADGPLKVEFRRVATVTERVFLTLLVGLNAGTAFVFLAWLVRPEHVPGFAGDLPAPALWASRLGFALVVLVELVRLLQNAAVWVYAFHAKDPVPVDPPTGWRVAMLTTIVPSKEPIDLVERTLRRMLQVAYCGTVDVWILDEGDDPDVKAMAARLGVKHFSRAGRPEYNQPAGEFRARSKAGNHNAWRAEHEHEYDVVAQMDPDHVPMPHFLERTLGYFRDPDVAFVVAPQVYGNMYDNWVAHGASVQQYLFSGVVERGGNGLDAPLLIGTNHLYRPAALAQIGGYQDSIIEDHLTSMRIHGAVNPATGRKWKGIYTPDVLAIGEGPTSWADYFNQQKRWAYGIWEILLRRRGAREGLSARQRLMYGCVQFYYPSVAVSLMLGTVATAMYLLFGITSIELESMTWLGLWSLSLGSWFGLWFWLRRFNLAEHERVEVGMPGIALSLFAGPVYVAAACAALVRRPLTYAVTAKGRLASGESLATFRLHLAWAGVGAAVLAASFLLGNDSAALRLWGALPLVAGLGPPLILLWVQAPRRLARLRARLIPAGTATQPTAPSARGEASAPWATADVDNEQWHQAPTRLLIDPLAVRARRAASRITTYVIAGQRLHDADRTERSSA